MLIKKQSQSTKGWNKTELSLLGTYDIFPFFRDTNNFNSEVFYIFHFLFLNPIWKTIHRDFLPHSNQWNLIVSLFWCWMNVKMAHDAARLFFIPHVPASLRVTTATIHRNYSSLKIPKLCMSFFLLWFMLQSWQLCGSGFGN